MNGSAASVLRAQSRYDEALAAARRAVDGARQLGYVGTLKVGFTQGIGPAFSLDDRAAVRGFVETIDAMRPGHVTPFLRALADRSRARLEVLDGDHGTAERNFKSAIGLFRETGIPYRRALSQIEYAESLADQRRGGEAEPLLMEARDTLVRLVASRWLDRLDQAGVGVSAGS